MKILKLTCLVALISTFSLQAFGEPLLKDGGRLAIAGDSITEQKLYTVYMEAYVVACSGLKDVSVFQYGWGGEKAPGLVARMDYDTFSWKPTVMTTCYGMNDGTYKPYNPDTIGKPYKEAIEKIVHACKDNGVSLVLGSPGVVDSKSFKRIKADVYNENLGELAAIDKSLAAEAGITFADVHSVMMDAMKKSKAALGEDYIFAGTDGFHPSPNGHLAMAYAFLKALGFDGQIALIEMDYNGACKVSGGHKLLNASKGKVGIESSRYPFCVNSAGAGKYSAESVLPYLPFNEDLNRFILKVSNLPSTKAEVRWGSAKKEFTKEELEKGVNLAAEFPENPFSKNFSWLLGSVLQKQRYETWIVKSFYVDARVLTSNLKDDKEAMSALTVVKERLIARQAEMAKVLKETVMPLKHTIEISPVD